MKMLRARGTQILLAITIAVSIYILWIWFFPFANYYLDDEWFFLPERAWSASRAAWLKHLLFFNQTRITFVGDYILVRPGLFFWAWLQDILFRSHRSAQQIFAMFVSVTVLASLCRMVWREAGMTLALAGCAVVLTVGNGHYAWDWPHLSGYLVAIGLYTAAMTTMVRTELTRRQALSVAATLMLATLFHEFVALTLVLLILTELIFWRRQNLQTSNRRLLAMAAPLLIFSALVLVTFVVLRPPAVFSPAEDAGLHLDSTHLYYMGLIAAGLVAQTIDHLVPFHSEQLYWTLLHIFLGALLLGYAVRTFGRRLSLEQRRRVVVCLLPVLALMIGLLMGRVATRFTVKGHYFPIFQFYLVMAMLLIFGPMLRAKPWLLSTVVLILLASAVHSAWSVQATNLQPAQSAAAIDRAVVEITERIEQIPARCFAGVFQPEGFREFNAGVNIALYGWTCGERAGEPMYFYAFADGRVREFQIPTPSPSIQAKDLTSQVGLPQTELELAPYLTAQPVNFREVEQPAEGRGELTVRPIYQPVQTIDLSLSFQSEDIAPPLFNVGFRTKSQAQTFYFLLLNNVLRVLQKVPGQPAVEIASSPVAQFPSAFTLRVVDIQSHCLVFLQRQLILQTKSCLSGQSDIAVIELKNGTPPEHLVGVSYF